MSESSYRERIFSPLMGKSIIRGMTEGHIAADRHNSNIMIDPVTISAIWQQQQNSVQTSVQNTSCFPRHSTRPDMNRDEQRETIRQTELVSSSSCGVASWGVGLSVRGSTQLKSAAACKPQGKKCQLFRWRPLNSHNHNGAFTFGLWEKMSHSHYLKGPRDLACGCVCSHARTNHFGYRSRSFRLSCPCYRTWPPNGSQLLPHHVMWTWHCGAGWSASFLLS